MVKVLEETWSAAELSQAQAMLGIDSDTTTVVSAMDLYGVLLTPPAEGLFSDLMRLPLESLRDLLEAFSVVDQSGRGVVSRAEAVVIFNSLLPGVEAEDVESVANYMPEFCCVDVTEDGEPLFCYRAGLAALHRQSLVRMMAGEW